MGDINYAPLIDDMVWSYSRIKTFEDCPYRWYLKYIRRLRGKDMFFASYGTFMHKLIELYLKGEKNSKRLVDMYLQDFRNEVVGFAPSKKIFTNYFTSGLQYLKNIQPFPYKMLDVEKRVDFSVNGIPFCGYIDFLGEKDGSFYVVDNKSRALKQRSNRAKPTKSDKELDNYLRQLYLYSIAVEEQYGVQPNALCFNYFRNGMFITEPFKDNAYCESKDWLSESIDTIREESEFNPSVEFFKCSYLCEMQEHCEYYDLMKKR